MQNLFFLKNNSPKKMEKQNINLSFDNDLQSISSILNENISFNSQSNLQPQIKKEYLTIDTSQIAKKFQPNEKYIIPDQIIKMMYNINKKYMEGDNPVVAICLRNLVIKLLEKKLKKSKIKKLSGEEKLRISVYNELSRRFNPEKLKKSNIKKLSGEERLVNSVCNELLRHFNPKKFVKKFVKENFIKIPKKHDNMSFDNIMRRIKNLITNSFLTFINKKIKEIYKDSNIKLEKIEKFNAENTNIKFNREFFSKPIKDILSEKITSRCSTKNKDYNKKIIDKLLKDENEEKRNVFDKILNLKFIDLVKYLRGEKEGLDELEGLEFDKLMWNKIKSDENYLYQFINVLNDIEIILKNKKTRKSKKSTIKSKIKSNKNIIKKE